MPVRIYDIAKKLGIESKQVLVVARDLGITTAKVASSTIDKISAEYLEKHLASILPPPAPPAAPPPVAVPPVPDVAPVAAPPIVQEVQPPVAPEPVAAPPIAAVTEPPIVPVTEPPIAAVTEPPAPALGELPPVKPLTIEETVPPPAPHVEEPVAPPPAPPISPLPPKPPQVPQPVQVGQEAPLPVEPVAPPPVKPTPQAVQPETLSIPVGSIPPPSVPGVAQPAAPPPVPPPPPPPPPPRIGDKIGFIALPIKPKPAEKQPPAKGIPRAPGKRERPSISDLGRGPVHRPSTPLQVLPTIAKPAEPPKPASPGFTPLADGVPLSMKPPITVRDLAEPVKKKPFQLIADLMEMNVFARVNDILDNEIAKRLAAKYGFRLTIEVRKKGAGPHVPVRPQIQHGEKEADLQPRAPVVTIMGHVDHGKTTLLDAIRKSNVAAGEAGGITQHIGAYTISVPHPDDPGRRQQITFIDTPGHAAFSAMRARGANVTDIVVLVVAANDGVMPQTIEALNHALAANVKVMVAVNKIDHPNSAPMKVRQQLQEKGIVPEEWGGDHIFVDVSALTKQGIGSLLKMIVLQAEMMELMANPNRRAEGNVIESGLEPGGPTATVLVRKGTLRVGDVIVCAYHYGKVRALVNEENKRLKEAGPSTAVKVLGMNGVPEPGTEFNAVENERAAREICEPRAPTARDHDKERRPRVSLEDFLQKMDSGAAKILRVVLKADTQGSVEAISDALKKIESTKVSIEIIHSAVGAITENDVLLASASQAVILGFQARIDADVSELAKQRGVQIKLYAIIYELIDEVKDAMAGLLDPILKESVFGAAEVRKVFTLSKGGNVAGCIVLNGRIVKGKARVMRRKNLIFEGIIHTLRRFQDDVSEVRSGLECGIRIDGFNEFQTGDTIECYTIEKVPQKL